MNFFKLKKSYFFLAPKQTANAIDEDGWMQTGDLATIDDEGYCTIVGRIKDMSIRGGENIYPREIEEFYYTHPAIEIVQVFGIPDPKYGEQVVAWIKLREGMHVTVEQLKEFAKGEIAHYKIPQLIMFTDSFPMTITGKIQKFEMRNITIQKLGLDPNKS
jgi:fatty-acyl-CoA synthase